MIKCNSSEDFKTHLSKKDLEHLLFVYKMDILFMLFSFYTPLINGHIIAIATFWQVLLSQLKL